MGKSSELDGKWPGRTGPWSHVPVPTEGNEEVCRACGYFCDDHEESDRVASPCGCLKIGGCPACWGTGIDILPETSTEEAL